MRRILLFLMLITWTLSKGQGVPFDKYSTDTFRLNSFEAKKIIFYRLNSVTFCVDYYDFIKMYTLVWKHYKEDQKYLAKAKKRGEYFNPNIPPMWTVLDSMYKVMTTDIKSKDTIYINHTIFHKVGFGTWNNFFPELIEKKRCAILNNNSERQFFVIRQKGTWYRGHLAAWGGRRYFLIGQTNYFIDGTDWIS